MTFLPAASNHGIKFQRVDLPGQPIADADVDYVVDTSRGTTIEHNGARINTVEHVLASLVGLEIDNVLIQLDGPEPPIMDGSSIKFVEALKDAGPVEHAHLCHLLWVIKNRLMPNRDLMRQFSRDSVGNHSLFTRQGLYVRPNRRHIQPSPTRSA